MSVSNIRPRTAYGITDALLNTPPMPIISKRAPLTSDMAPLGQIWIYTTTNTPYILTSIVSNLANWTLLVASGGAGVFTSVTAATTVTAGTGFIATAGGLAATAGNITTAAGNMSASGSVTAGTSMSAGTTITAGTGISATAGDIVAVGAGSVGGIVEAAKVLQADGDSPTMGLGTTTQYTGIKNGTPVSSGVFSITGTTATPGTNAGFIKIWVGTQEAWIPYFISGVS